MKVSLSGLCFFSMFLVALNLETSQAAQPLTKVLMTTGSFSEREAAMYVAQDQGFFRRYGLELTFVHVRSGPIGMAALAAGESQLHEEIGRASCRESGTVAVVGTRDNVTDPIVLW